MCLLVSGKKTAVKTTARKVTIPATINGSEAEYDTVRAEIAGPKINPNPHEAPITPNPRARYSCDVVSEITAEITGIFPAVIPSNARAIKRKMAFGANAAIKNETAVPKIEIKRSGFLPYLSDILPMTGVAIN